MSIAASFLPSESQSHLATNLGWSQFGDWTESLDATAYPNLVQLFEHGANAYVRELGREIESALEYAPPVKEVESTAEVLLSAIHANDGEDEIIVTAGVE